MHASCLPPLWLSQLMRMGVPACFFTAPPAGSLQREGFTE